MSWGCSGEMFLVLFAVSAQYILGFKAEILNEAFFRGFYSLYWLPCSPHPFG
jgi:hypothetical protein